jgi:hypothetical protein
MAGGAPQYHHDGLAGQAWALLPGKHIPSPRMASLPEQA